MLQACTLYRGGKRSSQGWGERRLRQRMLLFQKLQWTSEDVCCCTLICKTLPLQPDSHSPHWKTLHPPSFPQRLRMSQTSAREVYKSNLAWVVGSNRQGGELPVSQAGQDGFKERNMSFFHDGEMQYGHHFFPILGWEPDWRSCRAYVFQQLTHFQEDWGILRTVGSRSNSPRTLKNER